MQYKIPQNVGIEDKIVGPLTLRQLIILAVGCGISYVLFAIMSKLYELNILEYIIIAIPAVLAAAFALIKINDVPLIKFLFLFLEFSIKPKKRIWDHRGIAALVAPDLTVGAAKTEVTAAEGELDEKAKKAANLRGLTQVLDSGGFEHMEPVEHKDIDTVHDDNLVTQAYFGHKESKTENMYWRTTEAHKAMLDHFASLPVTQLKKGTKEAAIAQAEVAKVEKEVEEMQRQKKGKQVVKAATNRPAPKPAQAAASPICPNCGGKMTEGHVCPIAPKAQAPAQSEVATQPKKKPRKRKRPVPQPVRKNNQVNTINKNQPTEYIPKAQQKQKSAPQPKTADTLPKGGEFDIRDLEKGEIEINLD